MTLQNATSQHPQTYYCRHMQPGIAKYENETILVDSDGMKNLVGSVGKRSIPVYINHQDVDLKNIKEKAAGYVTDSFYNQLDGWGWFKFIAIDDTAHDAIKKGWAVSNAYMPTEWGPAGTKNNCPYNREVRNGEFTHLAIVPDPRYEGACIMTPDEFKNYQTEHEKKLMKLHNSKGSKTMKFKFFKTAKEEVSGSAIDLDTSIELENGKSATIGEMVALLENSKGDGEGEEMVTVNGKEMSVTELVESYTNAKKKMKKNGGSKAETADDSGDEDVEGDQDDEGDDEIGEDKKNKKTKKNKKSMKKNADDDDSMDNASEDDDGDEMDNKKKTKKNSLKEVDVDTDDKYFTEMRNAHLKPQEPTRQPLIRTSIDGVALGKKRYGSGA